MVVELIIPLVWLETETTSISVWLETETGSRVRLESVTVA